jgi:hypothetical protein
MNNTSDVAWGLAKGIFYYYGLRVLMVLGFTACLGLVGYVIYGIIHAI